MASFVKRHGHRLIRHAYPMNTTTIRPATEADVPYLIMLADVMLAESSFSSVPFDQEAFALTVIRLLDDRQFVMLAEKDGQVVGAMLGIATPFAFSYAMMAQDIALFVHPGARGRMISVRLVKAFEEWAKERNCLQIRPVVSSGCEAACRLYGLLGYRPVGVSFVKEV